jgi:hypothetical protein
MAGGVHPNPTVGLQNPAVGLQVAIPEAVLLATLSAQPAESELPTEGQGSNWWALGASRTSTASSQVHAVPLHSGA